MDVNDFKEWAIKIGQKAMAKHWPEVDVHKDNPCNLYIP